MSALPLKRDQAPDVSFGMNGLKPGDYVVHEGVLLAVIESIPASKAKTTTDVVLARVVRER